MASERQFKNRKIDFGLTKLGRILTQTQPLTAVPISSYNALVVILGPGILKLRVRFSGCQPQAATGGPG